MAALLADCSSILPIFNVASIQGAQINKTIGNLPAIYAIRECFHGEYGIAVSQANVMGILSDVLGAGHDRRLEIPDIRFSGGQPGRRRCHRPDRPDPRATARLPESRRGLGVIALGLFAACLLYGDGMITPAISVLSAVEGIGIITPVFDPYVIPLTIAILCGLFLIQRHGTARVGGLFGPVILIWLCFLAVTGAVQMFVTRRCWRRFSHGMPSGF